MDRPASLSLVRQAVHADHPTITAAGVRSECDVEVSMRVYADGGSIVIMRRTVEVAGSAERRTVGIDAVIR